MEECKTVYYSIVNKKDIIIDNTSNRSETIQEIYTTPNGKPYFKDSNIFFNYSHSKNYVACVISTYEVGIDIEETNRDISDEIAEKYLNKEKDNLKRIETWVKKEAYSKLKGLGFQINFKNINLSEITEKNLFISEKNYMCSIYCDNDDVEFKELGFNGSVLL